MIAAREEYDRRQKAVIDAQMAFQTKRYEDARRVERQKREPTEKVEQMSLYSYL